MSSISINNWVEIAILLLDRSLNPVPVELNELDWKSGLSDKNARLAQHISAFANYPGGGYLAYGILNSGSSKSLSKEDMDNIIQKIGNIARNNLAQPVGIDHAIVEYQNNLVLFIHIPEHTDKPVYLRGSDITLARYQTGDITNTRF